MYLLGIRRPFTLFKRYAVTDADAAECLVYDKLREHQTKDDPPMFGISAAQAAALLDTLLPPPPSTKDFQREDELLAAATEIAIKTGKIS